MDFIFYIVCVTGVSVHQSVFAGLQHSSAFTTKAFEKGHMFGPFQGKKVYTSEIKTNDGNSHMWEVRWYNTWNFAINHRLKLYSASSNLVLLLYFRGQWALESVQLTRVVAGGTSYIL